MAAFIRGVSVWGPGLEGWAASRPILAGLADYSARDLPPPVPAILSAAERRRTGLAVRLALSVATEASAMAGIAPGAIASVFATAIGDGVVLAAILEAVAGGSPVSPTQFHNSVHNAAAGYWSIATGSRQEATCLAMGEDTAAAALLKAMVTVQVTRRPVLLCLYDAPLPPPLDACRPTTGAFAVGFVLAPKAGDGAVSRLGLTYRAAVADPGAAVPRVPGLRALAAGNPAARVMRLLEALARGTEETLSLALLNGMVDITVQPCSPGPPSST